MSIKISMPESYDMKPKLTVFGVGGAGGNAVNNMIAANLEGIEFWVANTDAQALEHALTNNRIQLGSKATKGLGAGSHPEIGKQAAEESIDDVLSVLENANMVFITAGMGGGTGTGAAPVIAKAAKERNILTVGVVTKPFHFEGARRMKVAELGLEELNKYVDTLIVIPNQNLFRIANENTTFADAFKMADDVLHSGVRGITDLITMPGLINLDFADIRTVMSEMGKAMMGTGEADGENRAVMAAEAAISNPLLDNSSMKGARGVLINITGGSDMTLFQVDAAANRIREEVDPNANIIFGSAFNPDLDGKIRVSVVATGIDGKSNVHQTKSMEAIQSPFAATLNAPQLNESANTAANEEEFTDAEDDQMYDEADEAEENEGFIPPKPMEFSQYDSQEFAAAANEDEASEEEALEYPKAVNDIDSIKDNAQNSAQRDKAKEDFFDIPAFIRKRIKF
jgi:cell division protein FtsZ